MKHNPKNVQAATEEMSSVATEEKSSVATEDMSSVATQHIYYKTCKNHVLGLRFEIWRS